MPPEIRNRIYAYILGGRRIDLYSTELGLVELYKEHDGFKIDKSNPFLLLRVCRQVYAESCLLPYSLNTFLFYPSEWETWHMQIFPAQREAIRMLEFCGCEECMIQEAYHLSNFPAVRDIYLDTNLKKRERKTFEAKIKLACRGNVEVIIEREP